MFRGARCTWVASVLTLFVIRRCTADTCPVFLTLSSLSRNIEDASVVINWGPDCEAPPEWLALHTDNPALSDSPPVEKVIVNGKRSGQIVTSHKFGRQTLPGGWHYDQVLLHIPKRRPQPVCFDFYLTAYDRHRTLLSLDCLKIQPNWMFAESNLGTVPLKSLFLPGSHCSGCYQTRGNVGNVVLKKIGYRQDLDIWRQLVFGIRYLDFSVGYFPSHNGTRNFWIMNDSFRVGPVASVLRDIRRFVTLAEETVFLDFRQFPLGFHNHPEQHGGLLALLELELGDLIYRRTNASDDGDAESYDLTIDDMRRAGKHILVTYNHEPSLNVTDLMWKPWKKHSSSYLKHTELGEFMQNLFAQKHPDAPRNIGWSLHGVQGLQSSYNDEDATFLLPKQRANLINPRLMNLLGGPWSLRANAVLLDYFTNTNLIDMAVHANRYKTLHRAGNETVVLDLQ